MRDKKFERNLKRYMVMILITFMGYTIALFTIYPKSAIVESCAVFIFFIILLLSKRG